MTRKLVNILFFLEDILSYISNTKIYLQTNIMIYVKQYTDSLSYLLIETLTHQRVLKKEQLL